MGRETEHFSKHIKIDKYRKECSMLLIISKTGNQHLQELSDFPCSPQHCSQYPRHGTNLSVCQQINE